MAIFVIEDDAQNGADHVDAHRTVGLVISPYVKRKSLDSTLYTPPLFPDGSNQLDCYLLNISDETREARIEVLTKDAERVGHDKVTLKPGTEKVVSVPANLAPRYCKFEVEGKRSNWRGSVLVREPGRGSISALAAE